MGGEGKGEGGVKKEKKIFKRSFKKENFFYFIEIKWKLRLRLFNKKSKKRSNEERERWKKERKNGKKREKETKKRVLVKGK